MIRPLFDGYDIVYTPNDIAEMVIHGARSTAKILINYDTKQGFSIIDANHFEKIASIKKNVDIYSKHVIYSIWNGNDCIYVGVTDSENNTVYNRISRYIKELRDNSASTEGHASARNMRYIMGNNDIDISQLDLYVTIYNDYNKIKDIHPQVNYSEVERRIAKMLNARFFK